MSLGPPVPMGTARTRVPRRGAVLVAAVLTVAFVLVHASALAVVGLIMLGTVVSVPAARRRERWFGDVLAWVPLGACTVFAAALLVVVGSGTVGASLWGGGRAPATLILLVVLLAAAGLARGGRLALWSPASVLAWLPALGLAAAQAYRFHQPMAFWSRPAWALTDWVNNSEMTVDLFKNGLLQYTSASQSAGGPPTVYPRGLHGILAWLISATTSTDSTAQAWVAAVTAVSAAVAALSVLAVAAAALVSIAAARRLGAPTWILVTAPLLTSLLMLHPLVYQFLGLSGFMTTGAASVVLFALLLLTDAGPADGGYAFRLAATAMLAMGVFYLWQLLLLPVVLVGGYLAWRWWSAGRAHVGLVVGAGVVAAVACLPLALVTVSSAGAGQAKLAANVQSGPTWVVLVAVAAPVIVMLAARPRPAPLGTVFVIVSLVLVGLGMVLTALLGGSLVNLPYYATKILWHAGVVALPVLVASACVVVDRAARSSWLARMTPGRPLVRVVLVFAPVVLLAAYVGGGLSFGLSRSLSTLAAPGGGSPQVAMVVLTDPAVLAGSRPVLPYLLHPQGWQLWERYDDWHAAQILRTLGNTVPPGDALLAHRANEVCTWLAANPDAIRLTGPRLGYEELMERGCPADVVRPERWSVLVTPAEWWDDTAWEGTGGAPDPAIQAPNVLFGSAVAG